MGRFGGRMMLVVGLTVCCCLARVQASAIPMWEFLTREEKMSQLYRIFSQEVSEFCAESSMPDCNKNLLVQGVKTLANMHDDQLDEIDPYQRGAKDLIWRALVGNMHLSGLNRLDQQNSADQLAFGDNELPGETSQSNDYAHPADLPGPYLLGPMVIRVFPDGRPVPQEARLPLPRDEDIEDTSPTPRLPKLQDLQDFPGKAHGEPAREQPSTELLPPRMRKSSMPLPRFYRRNGLFALWRPHGYY